MRNKVYLFIIATIVIIALMVACNKKPTAVSAFSIEPTGAVDANGNVIDQSEYTITNKIYITNEKVIYVTNNQVITNYVQTTVTVTNTVVKEPPAKATDNYKLYVPWAGDNGKYGNNHYYTISYKDTEGLKQLYLNQMKGKGNGGKRFNIRDRSNHYDFGRYKQGNDNNGGYYYYIKDNGDIHYKRTDEHGTPDRLIKKFVGATIVATGSYYTVGGIYALAIPKNGTYGYLESYGGYLTNNQYGKQTRKNDLEGGDSRVGVVDFISIRLGQMIRHRDGISITYKTKIRDYDEGYLETLVLNNSTSASSYREFAIVSYYYYNRNSDGGMNRSDYDLQFMTNASLYMGERPEYVNGLFKEYAELSVNRWQNHYQAWWFTFAMDY